MATITPPSDIVSSGLDTRFFGHPRGPCHPVLHRDVGALQLLRHARPADSLHDRSARPAAGWVSAPRRPARSTGPTSRWSYLTSLPGGWIADRFLGQRRATLYGGIIIMLRPHRAGLPVARHLLSRPRTGGDRARGCSSRTSARWSAASTHRKTCGAIRASRSSTWGSISARSSPLWSVDGSRRASNFAASSDRSGSEPEERLALGLRNDGRGACSSGSIQYLRGWKYLGDDRDASGAAGE